MFKIGVKTPDGPDVVWKMSCNYCCKPISLRGQIQNLMHKNYIDLMTNISLTAFIFPPALSWSNDTWENTTLIFTNIFSRTTNVTNHPYFTILSVSSFIHWLLCWDQWVVEQSPNTGLLFRALGWTLTSRDLQQPETSIIWTQHNTPLYLHLQLNRPHASSRRPPGGNEPHDAQWIIIIKCNWAISSKMKVCVWCSSLPLFSLQWVLIIH